MKRSEYLPNLPLNPGHVRRPRLNKLLSELLESSLVSITAGPGYGKTSLVSSYVQKLKTPVIWINLTPLDNNPTFFWKTLAVASEKELPKLTDLINSHTFPGSLQETSEFIMHAVEGDLMTYAPQKITLVLDNYDVLNNQQVINFLDYTQSINLLYAPITLSQILISDKRLSDLPLHPASTQYDNARKFKTITARDLALNKEEIKELLAIYGKAPTHYTLEEIQGCTEGWPLLVHSLAANPGDDYEPVLQIISTLFTNQYFNNYSKIVQNLLVELSVFQTFTFEILSHFMANYPEESRGAITEVLFHNPFIEYIYSKQQFYFLKPYHVFLVSKFLTLDDQKQIAALDIARNYLFDYTEMKRLIELYIKARNPEGITMCLMMLAPYNPGPSYSYQIINFLQQIPAQDRIDNPWIDFFIALNQFKANQLFAAENAFYDLISTLLTDVEKNKEILGESYAVLSIISITQNRLMDIKLLDKLVSYLPNGSILMNKYTLAIGENSGFFMPVDHDYTVPQIKKYLHTFTYYFLKISNGCLSGYDCLFDAEASLMVCDFKQAEYYANQAIFKASIAEQHDIVLSAYNILIRYAFIAGDYAALTAQIQSLDHYYAKYQPHNLSDLKDILYALYYFHLNCSDRAASWIKDFNLSRYKEKPQNNGRNVFICAIYALQSRNFPHFHALLDELEQLLAVRGLWALRVCYHTLCAVLFDHLGSPAKVVSSFKKSYEMVYQNNLFFLLIEFGEYLLPILEIVRSSEDPDFDYEWIDLLESKTKNYIKSLHNLQKFFVEEKKVPILPSIRLTSREKQVLLLLSQGLSRSEIALNLNISVSGVQKFLSNIYLKLGAKNGADAVSIALSNNII